MNALNSNLRLARIGTRLKNISPYFLLELLLPGGSIFALLLWLHRRNQNASAPKEAVPGAVEHKSEVGPGCCHA